MTSRFLMLSGDSNSPISGCTIGAGDPFAKERAILWSDGSATFAGRTAATRSSFSGQYPHTEMLVIASGQVRVTVNGRATDLTAGHAAVIPSGAEVTIEVNNDAAWSFYAALPASWTSAAEEKLPVFMTGSEPLQPSPPPPPETLITAAPVCGVIESLADDATASRYGIWSATPYARTVQNHKGHEMMHVIEGGMTLSNDEGFSLDLSAGDTVFVPKGSSCGWASTVAMRKYYAGT